MVCDIQLSLDSSNNTLLKLKLRYLYRGRELRIIERAFPIRRSCQRALDRQVLSLNCFQFFQRYVIRIQPNVVTSGLGVINQVCVCRTCQRLQVPGGIYGAVRCLELKRQSLNWLVIDTSLHQLRRSTSDWIELRALQRDIPRKVARGRILQPRYLLQLRQQHLLDRQCRGDWIRWIIRPVPQPHLHIEGCLSLLCADQRAVLQSEFRCAGLNYQAQASPLAA